MYAQATEGNRADDMSEISSWANRRTTDYGCGDRRIGFDVEFCGAD